MKRFRVLQTGDLHIGAGRASWGVETSLSRASLLFDVLYRTAAQQKCHAILICGDVFDTKHVSNAERELVARKLAENSRKIPTFVISGNHDMVSDTNGNLDFLSEITENTSELPNLHVSPVNRVSLWKDSLPEGLQILGFSAPQSEDIAIIEEYVSKIETPTIVMGHATIYSCYRNDSNWRPEEAKDKGFSLAEASKNENVLYWAFGDIHKRQKLPTLAPNAVGWYAGSPIQMNFGELPDRGALVVAFDQTDDGWVFRGKKYVRMDDQGFAPLVRVLKEEHLDDLPEKALLQLASGLVLPTSRHEQVVKTFRVVEDLSTPQKVIDASGSEDGQIQLFNFLLASEEELEAELLSGVEDAAVYEEIKRLIPLARDRFQERNFVA